MQVNQDERVHLDLNSSLGRQWMRGQGGGERMRGEDWGRLRGILLDLFFYSMLNDFNGVLKLV